MSTTAQTLATIANAYDRHVRGNHTTINVAVADAADIVDEVLELAAHAGTEVGALGDLSAAEVRELTAHVRDLQAIYTDEWIRRSTPDLRRQLTERTTLTDEAKAAIAAELDRRAAALEAEQADA